MKQLLILSGKGGTGKTSLVASFAALAGKSVLVDADVDAADLHLVVNSERIAEEPFEAGVEAEIDSDKCVECGLCREVCRFDAIDESFTVDPLSCEGCGFCSRICPEEAIKLLPCNCGSWFRSKAATGPFMHAQLGIAAENSGKLVSLVREKAKEAAESEKADLILIDGPPGIGCPVIASITGCDLVLIVTEPTVSGLHDLERVAQLTKHFKIPALVVVNKFDLDIEMCEKIESFAKDNGYRPIGRIPFEKAMVEALVAKTSLVEHADNEASKAIREIWNRTSEVLNNG